MLTAILGGGLSLLKSIWGFLAKLEPFQLLSLALGVALLVTIGQRNDARHDAAAWEKQFNSERTAHKRTVESYKSAQREAELRNKAQVAEIKAKQEAITDEVTDDLNSRLERIRSELRRPQTKRPAQGTGTGDPGKAPCIANDPAWLCLAPEERLRGAENEERHDQLITWTEKQSKVDPNS